MSRPGVFILAAIALLVVGVALLVRSPEAAPKRPHASTTSATIPSAPRARLPIGGARQPEDAPDIYSLLPFSEQSIAAATELSSRFMQEFFTQRYDEDPRDRVARLAPLVTDSLHAKIQQNRSSPGLLADYRTRKRITTGHATTEKIAQIRNMPMISITFVVGVDRTVIDINGTEHNSEQYSVDVVRAGRGWRVDVFDPVS